MTDIEEIEALLNEARVFLDNSHRILRIDHSPALGGGGYTRSQTLAISSVGLAKARKALKKAQKLHRSMIAEKLEDPELLRNLQ